jgi:hypothetical protein
MTPTLVVRSEELERFVAACGAVIEGGADATITDVAGLVETSLTNESSPWNTLVTDLATDPGVLAAGLGPVRSVAATVFSRLLFDPRPVASLPDAADHLASVITKSGRRDSTGSLLFGDATRKAPRARTLTGVLDTRIGGYEFASAYGPGLRADLFPLVVDQVAQVLGSVGHARRVVRYALGHPALHQVLETELHCVEFLDAANTVLVDAERFAATIIPEALAEWYLVQAGTDPRVRDLVVDSTKLARAHQSRARVLVMPSGAISGRWQLGQALSAWAWGADQLRLPFAEPATPDLDPEVAWARKAVTEVLGREPRDLEYRQIAREGGPDQSLSCNAEFFAALYEGLAEASGLMCATSDRERNYERLLRLLHTDVVHADEVAGTSLERYVRGVAPRRRTRAQVERPVVPEPAQRVDVVRFLREYVTANRSLPTAKDLDRDTLAWVESCGEDLSTLVDRFEQVHGPVRSGRSTNEEAGERLVVAAFPNAEHDVQHPVRFRLGTVRKVDLRVRSRMGRCDVELWFEFDGEFHFQARARGDLEQNRAYDRDRHVQVRDVTADGGHVTLVALHHRVLTGAKVGRLTASQLADVVRTAVGAGWRWVFVRPVGCDDMRANLSDPDTAGGPVCEPPVRLAGPWNHIDVWVCDRS